MAALLFSAITHAQVTFQRGYFIDNKGNKTHCYIENRDWRNNPTAFTYKLQETDSEKKTENIMGVSEFGIDNESLYRRFTVEIERSQTLMANLQKNKTPNFRVETLFLLAVVTGEANLYSYVDGNVNKFFYDTKTTPIEQLVMIKYTEDDLVGYNYQFRQQLYNNVRCAKMPDADFKKIEYREKPLAQHFERYNSCTQAAGENVNYTNLDKKREVFALRITPGVYQAAAQLRDPDDYYDASTDLNQTVFKFSIDAEFILPFNRNSWSIFLNPGYCKFDPVKSYTSLVNNPGFANDGDTVHYTATADYSGFEIPIGIRRYLYVNPNSRLFVDVAYVVGFGLSDPSIAFTNNDNLTNADVTIPINDKNNFAIGLGYAYKRFSVQVKFNTPRILSDYASWSAKFSSIGLNFGYKIF